MCTRLAGPAAFFGRAEAAAGWATRRLPLKFKITHVASLVRVVLLLVHDVLHRCAWTARNSQVRAKPLRPSTYLRVRLSGHSLAKAGARRHGTWEQAEPTPSGRCYWPTPEECRHRWSMPAQPACSAWHNHPVWRPDHAGSLNLGVTTYRLLLGLLQFSFSLYVALCRRRKLFCRFPRARRITMALAHL